MNIPGRIIWPALHQTVKAIYPVEAARPASMSINICASCCVRRMSNKPIKPHKGKAKIAKENYFVDFMKVLVVGGKGGNGMMSFSSLPRKEWAGPDGGNGGNGGHVIFKASYNVKSLAHLKEMILASIGIKGGTKNKDGKNASHRIVMVPLGTVIKTEGGRTLAELDRDEDMFIAARGGAGGKGNSFFLTNENRAPAIAEEGAMGQERSLLVELKIMADAGLIGFPNAGKSSLLRAISRAQPRVSAFPFTTLNPHIGMVEYEDHSQIAVADIPGLIPGAHQNKGLGISFLRHIERCVCLIYVIDMAMDNPLNQLVQLKFELNQYQPGLADRPGLLVCNKMDLNGADEKFENLVEDLSKSNESQDSDKSLKILGLSAKKYSGVEEFLQYLKEICDHVNKDKDVDMLS